MGEAATAVEDVHVVQDQDESADERLANLPGSAVLVSGRDVEGRDAIAVWVVAPSGRATGAWVPTRTDLAADPALALGLVRTIGVRALLGSTPEQAAELLTEMAGYAGAEHLEGADRAVSLPDAVDDLRDARRRCEAALDKARASSRQKLAPLSWSTEVTPTAVSTNDDVRCLARLAYPAGAPAPAEALMVVAGLRWVTTAWLETEQICRRRPALRDALPRFTSVPTRLAVAMGQTA